MTNRKHPYGKTKHSSVMLYNDVKDVTRWCWEVTIFQRNNNNKLL